MDEIANKWALGHSLVNRNVLNHWKAEAKTYYFFGKWKIQHKGKL